MDFTVQNDFPAEQIEYTLYDGDQCAQGSTVIPKDNNAIHSSMAVEPYGGDEHAKISFEVEAGAVSNMYRVIDDNHAELVLCVRFGLFTGPPSKADSIEVNFREVVFKLRATLDSGFQIEGMEKSL